MTAKIILKQCFFYAMAVLLFLKRTLEHHIMEPIFFETASAFRSWLKKYHKTATEIAVGYFKAGSGKKNMSWSESVDEALCYGWIDGVRNSIDGERYQIRFTPRKENSIWSVVNINKVEDLKNKGLMQPSGLSVFEKRKAGKSKIYAHEKEEQSFTTAIEKYFKTSKAAWKYFQTLAPGYQKRSRNWVMGAKQDATRIKRLDQLIMEFESGKNPWKDHKYNKK
jgi:uncharacterized protein YdeI (YjbR/CyaY-like superfamily)